MIKDGNKFKYELTLKKDNVKGKDFRFKFINNSSSWFCGPNYITVKDKNDDNNYIKFDNDGNIEMLLKK